MKLTPSQVEALRVLAARAPEHTYQGGTNDDAGGQVIAGSAGRLQDLGLADWTFAEKDRLLTNPRWHITDAGRLALDAIDAHAPKEDA